MTPGERLEFVDGITVDEAGPGELSAGFTNLRLIRGYLDTKEAEFARRQDLLADTVGAAPAADVIARGSKTSQRSAQKAAKRAGTLGEAPKMNKQLGKGNISGEHVDVLTSAASGLDDDTRAALLELDGELALAAASKTPEQFRRHVNKQIRAISDDDGVERSERQRDAQRLVLGLNEETGMGEIRGELHPDEWQKLNRRIDAEIAALRKLDVHAGKRRDQLAAIALVNVVTGQRATSRVPAEVVIHVGRATIDDMPGAPRYGEYVDGSPVPAETVRRHACDAQIIPVVLNGEGQPLDVGRARRLATPAQRTALRSMYRTCAVDGCSCSFDRCEVHHILEWTEHRGPTDLKYLIPVCPYHHHRFHEGRWRLELDPSTRELTVWYPDATLHSRSLPDRASDDEAA